MLKLHLSPESLALAVLALSSPISSQGLGVQTISPARNSVGASPAAPITVSFDAEINATTINPNSVRVFGRWSGVVPGILSVNGNSLIFTPTRPYFPSETVTITLSSQIASVGGEALAKGYVSTFWAAAMPGTGTFSLTATIEFRLPGEGAVITYGFSACDINRDGSPDMSATNEGSSDVRVVFNDGCGNFGSMQIHPMPGGSQPSPNESADFNLDGWPDLVTGNQGGSSIAVFLNDGAGTYLAPVFYPTGGGTHGVTVLDANGDGHTDVVAANLSNLVLFLNDGSGVLTQSGMPFDGGGDGEWQVLAGDANNDGISDLFVATINTGNVTLLLGDGAGGFTLSDSEFVGGAPWALALGDIDGDGNMDVAATRSNLQSAVILLGDGTGGLSLPIPYPTGSKPISVDLGDLEGDGDLDMTVSNFSGASLTVYTNDGSGIFESPVSLPAELAGACSVLMDHDRDGDTDIILIDERADKAFIWEQDGPDTAGIQQASCAGTLRLNGFAGADGFGNLPSVPAPLGSFLFINISGTPGAAYAVVFGNPLQPGIDFGVLGFLNLAIDNSLFFLVNGFAPPAARLDPSGETLLALPLPPGLPLLGLTLSLQALVQTPGGVALTNPETFSIVL